MLFLFVCFGIDVIESATALVVYVFLLKVRYKSKFFKGNGNFFRGVKYAKMFLLSFWKEVYSKRKEFAEAAFRDCLCIFFYLKLNHAFESC